MKAMTNAEAVQMMRRSSDEIKTLRRQVEVLAPKAEAYDAILSILALLPKPSRGYGEDVAYMLDKRIREIEAVQAGEQAS